MPIIYIDDQALEVKDGDNILHAVLGLGLDLPYFCWHPAMGSVGACRQCALVQYRDEQDTRGRIVMGCMTPVSDGARFSMQGPEASEFRKNIIESLMLNHPHDCPVCAEGGECHLQDMTVMVGHRNRRYRGKKNTHRNQDLGPLVHHEMNRCITCYRCTRYYNDYAGGTDLAAQAAHDHVYFGRQEDGILESEFAGNLVEVCPTGVFTDKPLVNEYTRKWDLQSAPSVCVGCAAGCNTSPGERYGKLKRIHNRFNSQVNGYFLCDRGRYGGDFVNNEDRALFPGQRNDSGSYDAIESDHAIQQVATWCADPKRVAAIGSPRASLESNFLLSNLVNEQNFSSGNADYENDLLQRVKKTLLDGQVNTPSIKQIEAADAILVLGEDVTNTAPRLALALRQSVRNLAKELATQMRIPLWQDEAVRNLAQDQLSPMIIVTMSDTPLDDIALEHISLSPNDIARFGYAVAAELGSNASALSEKEALSESMNTNAFNDLDEKSQAQVKQTAEILNAAKRPLIISGTGAQSAAVIEAAAAVNRATRNSDAMLSYCLPECNSMGSALMQNSDHANLQQLCQKADNGEIDTLLILENDLYRRAPAEQINKLLSDVPQVVVLDALDSPTASHASLFLPSATFAESEGTLVSSEGRAQRHFPVFLPTEQRQPAWQWLLQIGKAIDNTRVKQFKQFDDITRACASHHASLGRISEAAPTAEFRDRNMKVPRQTHRYSGRTAMRSDISVHEPKQPVDNDTPLSFSMEGINSGKSGAVVPFVWSPAWNSNQSVHKFQDEAGGALKGGTSGVRLFESGSTQTNSKPNTGIPSAFKPSNDQWLLVPQYQIFGSEELSAHSPAVKELSKHAFVTLSPQDAEKLDVSESDFIIASFDQNDVSLAVRISSTIPLGCAGYGVGLTGSTWLAPQTSVSLVKSTVTASQANTVESITTRQGGQNV